MAIVDPLDLNYAKQSRELLRSIPSHIAPKCAPILSQIEHLLAAHSLEPAPLLSCLSEALAIPELAWLIASKFRPILIDLAARWLDSPSVFIHQRLCSLALLIEVHEELFPVILGLLHQLPSADILFASVVNENQPVPALEDQHALLLAVYRLLSVDPSLAPHLCLSDELLRGIMGRNADRGLRILAAHCFALYHGLPEAEREELLTASLGKYAEEDVLIHVGHIYGLQEIHGGAPVQDGWILPASEQDRILHLRAALEDECGFYDWSPSDDTFAPRLTEADLTQSVISVCGVLMFRQVSANRQASVDPVQPFVMTPSIRQALHELALRCSQRLPCLLSSSPSAGKTTLLHHLANRVHGSTSNVVSIHLADSSIDAKSLLGTYVSSPRVSGTFEWVDGPLVRAMKLGKWIVLEDVDRAGQDVLATIMPLLESMGPRQQIGGKPSIDTLGRGQVYASDRFMVFATRSVPSNAVDPSIASTSRPFPQPTFFGHQYFSEVNLPVPTMDELPSILKGAFPCLRDHAVVTVLNAWMAARHALAGLRGDAKDIDLLALLRFSRRVARLCTMYAGHGRDIGSGLSQSTLEELFLEALDVFVAHISKSFLEGAPRKAVDQIAASLNLSEERVSWILEQRTPELHPSDEAPFSRLSIGRVTSLKTAQHAESAPTSRHPFALHRPSLRLLEQLAVSVQENEPVLLVGETGTGKTTAVQHLASRLQRRLSVLNLSTQTETVDIIGGLKPIDPRVPATALQERYIDLFARTFSQKRNAQFVDSVRRVFIQGKWLRLCALWRESSRLALERLLQGSEENNARSSIQASTKPKKRRKLEDGSEAGLPHITTLWTTFMNDVTAFEAQHLDPKARFVFGFVEGPLVAALRKGEWILLDEINLASPDVLESILGLLEGPSGSITLTERGDLEPIPRHMDFRIFACMNPATDVGKKDLPPRLRKHFTETFVAPPEADRNALLAIVEQYLAGYAMGDRACVRDVVDLYLDLKHLVSLGRIADGANQPPHYNMRTVTRAMTYATEKSIVYGLRRALWEGFVMCFVMSLDRPSAILVRQTIQTHIFGKTKNLQSVLRQNPPVPGSSYTDEFAPFHIQRGPLSIPLDEGTYVLTPSVRTKLLDLARVVGAKGIPVLIQGPTSSGKTSAIEYLARRTGHRFVRINNHEHTDIQEYIGSYVSDPMSGKLIYQDGLLVRALRDGDWIVLDELNLAPSDVLEALNRLLDDNQELVIPETGEVIRPHLNFALFATQNPPGLYGGRKPLSRAFRNRFVEIHFDDVPEEELEIILCQRCRIAPSYAKRIVSVFRELQRRRQASRVFETKQSFATLRDLFRWANRRAQSVEQLAEHGFMLLAERARQIEDKETVRQVLEDILKVHINPSTLYDHPPLRPVDTKQLVMTSAMKRLWCLVGEAVRYNEPVLLVGETGTGKTSVCDLMAVTQKRPLFSVSCHLNTETSDLIGALRPVRDRSAQRDALMATLRTGLMEAGFPSSEYDTLSPSTLGDTVKALQRRPDIPSRLAALLPQIAEKLVLTEAFVEWKDGPLVEAMRYGGFFLLDEISLADDSVLERLNSVLEPSRSLVLAEKGGNDLAHLSIHGQEGFQFFATMNPGGDYGKKELSPALRNRFTEIYVPNVDGMSDRYLIIASSWTNPRLQQYTQPLLDFWLWIEASSNGRLVFGLRDILAWTAFMSKVGSDPTSTLPLPALFHHAARMTFIDALGFVEESEGTQTGTFVAQAMDKLLELVPLEAKDSASFIPSLQDGPDAFSIGPFKLTKGVTTVAPTHFTFVAPTTHENALRLVRAAQLAKPILLEGSPGVGKTSLVVALSSASGRTLCRINLSDQTELTDLFGSDLPVEGGRPGEFSWKSAPFLTAMETGEWVLLDEMNLAPQPVLEGLNAVLDHRGEVYVPELGRSFRCHPDFRVFAAQNPPQQGGDRKGLPKSFLNRFTRVYMTELTDADHFAICHYLFPDVPEEHLRQLVHFNLAVSRDVVSLRMIGNKGRPWEFNLRDLLRWLRLYSTQQSQLDLRAACQRSFQALYLSRFRSADDRSHLQSIFNNVFGHQSFTPTRVWFQLTEHHVQLGQTVLSRGRVHRSQQNFAILQSQMGVLETAGEALRAGWMVVLTGDRGCGKTSVARLLSHACGVRLVEYSVNSSTDTGDLLGGFEQWSEEAESQALWSRTIAMLLEHVVHHPEDRVSVDNMCATLPLRAKPPGDTPEPLSALVAQCLRLTDWLASYPSTNVIQLDALKRDLASAIMSEGYKGCFKWVDGPLVTAMREGHWLLLDNANLCNSAVLDRLNSVLEDNGALLLNERGLVGDDLQEIRPHPSFRIIMTVDPQYGELSRAMRNRGVEIFISSLVTGEQDSFRLLQTLRCPSNVPYRAPLLDVMLDAKKMRLGVSTGTQKMEVPSPSRVGRLYNALAWTHSRLARLVVPVEVSLMSENQEASCTYRAQATCDSENTLLGRIVKIFSAHSIGPLMVIPPSLRGYLAQARVALSQQLSLPQSFIATQPFDFALNPAFDVLTAMGQLQGENFLAAVLPDAFMLSEIVRSNTSFKKYPEDSDQFHDSGAWQQVTQLAHLATSDTLSFIEDVLVDREWLSEAEKISHCVLDLFELVRTLQAVILRPVPDWSTIAVVCAWFAKSLLLSFPCFAQTAAHLQALQMVTNPRTGREIYAIWWNVWNRFSSMGITYFPKTSSISLARQVEQDDTFNLSKPSGEISVLPSALPSDCQHITSTSRQATVNPSDSWAISISTLQQVWDFPHLKNPELLRSTLQLARDNPGYPNLQLVSWEAALSRSSTDIGASSALTFHLVYQWFDTFKVLWTGREYVNDLDPGLLFSPIELCNDIEFLGRTHTIDSLVKYKTALERRAQHQAISALSDSPNRVIQMKALLVKLTQSLCVAFASSYGPEQLERITSFSYPNLADAQGELWVDEICETSNPHVTEAVKTYLQSALIAMFRKPSSYPAAIRDLGAAWIGFSRALAMLYIPDMPTDPLVHITSRKNLLLHRKSNLLVQLELHGRHESLFGGQQTNLRMQSLQRRLASTQADLGAIRPPPISRSSDPAVVNAFFGEITQFMEQVVEKDRLDRLLQGLLEGTESTTLHQAESVGSSIDAFIERMHHAYPELYDVAFMAILSLRGMQMGIRLYSRAATMSKIEPTRTSDILSIQLSQFPSTAAVRHFCRPSGRATHFLSSTPSTKRVLLSLALIAKDACGAANQQPEIDHVQRLYQVLYLRWAAQQESDEASRLKRESLYRSKNEDYSEVEEEERTEREIAILFPDFDADKDHESSRSPSNNTGIPSLDIGQYTEQQLSVIHQVLFAEPRQAYTPSSTAMNELISRHQNGELVAMNLEEFTDTIDAGSRIFRITCLHHALSMFDPNLTEPHVTNDFYRGTNTIQLQKAFDILSRLRERLAALIALWPEQIQLQDIHDCSDAVLNRSLDSSLAQVIPGLERLISQIATWEGFASRANSLAAFQTELISLIVEWRRFELTSWARLLDSEDSVFSSKVSEWWFLLYGAIMHSSGPGSPESSRELTALLDDFFNTTPLGQFQGRLNLVLSFGRFLDKLSRQQAHFAESATLVTSIGKYYEQFNDAVRESLVSQRKPLEDEIRSFVKLASWKDVNVDALKQSAKKTHRHLYQTVRKYRRILQQPTVPVYLSFPRSITRAESIEIVDTQPVPDASALALYVPNDTLSFQGAPPLPLSKALERLRMIRTLKQEDWLNRASSVNIDRYASSLRAKLDAFSQETATNLGPAIQKALVARKRKAWYDALKELKSRGLTSRLPTSILEEQRERHRLFLYADPPTSSQDSLASILGKANAYFYKLCGMMPQLHHALINHHPDLPTRDLERAMGLVQSAFAVALKGRRLLHRSYDAYRCIGKIVDRLTPMMQESSTITLAACGTPAERYVQRLHSVAVALQSALCEMLEGLRLLRTYAPSGSGDAEVYITDLSMMLASQEDVVSRLGTIYRKTVSTTPCILLSDEHTACEDASSSMLGTYELLERMCQVTRQYSCMLEPTIQWLKAELDFTTIDTLNDASLPNEHSSPEEIRNSVITSVLLAVQHSDRLTPAQQDEPETQVSIQAAFGHAERLVGALHFENINASLSRLINATWRKRHDRSSLRDALMFLQEYGTLATIAMEEVARNNAAMFKLAYILHNAFKSVASQGFCKPPESGQSSGPTDSKSMAEGTGIGEGLGAEDDSAEVRDESQVEGTQEQSVEHDHDQKDQSPEKDAFEMSNDFEGALEDVAESENDQSDSDEEEEREEPDETAGGLDPLDPAALDEKLWGGTDSDEDPGSKESNKNVLEDAVASDEMAAQEDATNRQQNAIGDNQPADEPSKPQEGVENDMDSASGEDIDNEVPQNNDAPLGDALQLPEDMDLDLDNSSQLGSVSLSDDGERDDEQQQAVEESHYPGSPEEMQVNEGASDEDEQSGPREDEISIGSGEKEKPVNDQVAADHATSLDATGGELGAPIERNHPQNAQNTSSMDEDAPSMPDSDSDRDSTAKCDGRMNTALPASDTSRDAGLSAMRQEPVSLKDMGTDKLEREIEPDEGQQRVAGDISRPTIRASEPIQSTSDNSEVSSAKTSSGPLEWAREDEETSGEQQALGPQQDDDRMALDPLELENAEDQRTENKAEDMQDSEVMPDAQTMEVDAESIRNIPVEKSLSGSALQFSSTELDGEMFTDVVRPDDPSPVTLPTALDADSPAISAAQWQGYVSVTQDLAYSLCEQLRLILEPTRATRLQGDYKTGKRLNMRKVIPYIASDFTKDKIWLRRTKPSRREYQVLIALDDSRSMAESRSISLAFQTMALVSTALSKLEVGDVGIMRFGTDVEIIHDLESGPVTAQVGQQVLSHFNFKQTGTNMEKLLQSSVTMLADARARSIQQSHSGADLWQLEIIISDGVCQGHERLRSLVRMAEQERIVIVFIVLDSLHQQTGTQLQGKLQGSIMSMMQGEYAEVNGRMEIKMNRYMDTFPFNYFIILRDIEALPEVLTSTLRQFFEIR